ncbi:hypothetical protein BCR37DRAFT_389716 [Protomyces lactucae-debilis]|uniref:Uncharacterized protein n=1 Tax=Protomyces lactucae-debilis TaxID=2754530 RepID=A0A1Y2EW88_PROLT|nr:uncharacterized protein BCR37DRAFT_389716 [Protomyces lactucae-debilis]ORY75085.1 hypothetical protein BCR37DRAFT_389716 [Protomyces lactucae-debilis]
MAAQISTSLHVVILMMIFGLLLRLPYVGGMGCAWSSPESSKNGICKAAPRGKEPITQTQTQTQVQPKLPTPPTLYYKRLEVVFEKGVPQSVTRTKGPNGEKKKRLHSCDDTCEMEGAGAARAIMNAAERPPYHQPRINGYCNLGWFHFGWRLKGEIEYPDALIESLGKAIDVNEASTSASRQPTVCENLAHEVLRKTEHLLDGWPVVEPSSVSGGYDAASSVGLGVIAAQNILNNGKFLSARTLKSAPCNDAPNKQKKSKKPRESEKQKPLKLCMCQVGLVIDRHLVPRKPDKSSLNLPGWTLDPPAADIGKHIRPGESVYDPKKVPEVEVIRENPFPQIQNMDFNGIFSQRVMNPFNGPHDYALEGLAFTDKKIGWSKGKACDWKEVSHSFITAATGFWGPFT